MKIHLNILIDLMDELNKHSIKAYEALVKHDDDYRYTVASYYLSITHNSFMNFKVYAVAKQLENNHILTVFEAFEDFKSEFDLVIDNKDENSNSLSSKKEILKTVYEDINRFFDKQINYYKLDD